jgi:hypothetical protein
MESSMAPLSELEMRILSELEEAGEENISAMMNTVIQPRGEASELLEMQRALMSLVQADLVRMSMDRDASGRLRDLSQSASRDVIADLTSGLRFNRERMLWTDTRHSGPPYGDPFPYIVNTESGKEKGFQILDQRGYQWWRPKK